MISSGTYLPAKNMDCATNLIQHPEQEVKELWRSLFDQYVWSDVDKFRWDDGSKVKDMIKAVSELIEQCNKKQLTIKPTLLSDLPKGQTWFAALVTLCFSGVSIENYTAEELGLDMVSQDIDEHSLYWSVLEKLKIAGDIRIEKNYQQFMKDLVELDFMEEFKNEQVIAKVPGWQKSMQPELYHLATDADRSSRQGFDPNLGHLTKELRLYKYRHTFIKQSLLKPCILSAPSEFVCNLFRQWLDDHTVREWLFSQRYYPLNMLLGEHCPWNLLLSGLPDLLPKANSSLKTSFKQRTGFNEEITGSPENSPVWSSQWNNAFGRTLISKGVDNRYLKIQSNTESETEFKRGYSRLKLLHKGHPDLQLESLIPEPKGLYKINNPHRLVQSIKSEDLLPSARKTFAEKVNNQPVLAMEFSTPADAPYEEYIYDVANPQSALEALHRYARDYGRVWQHGLIPPPSLSAFHDVDAGRKHFMLTPFIKRKCEGALERWNGEGTNNPNIGGPKISMRDKVDIMPPEEKGPSFFRFPSTDQNELVYINKIRFEELAKAAQGLCLHYARRFNSQFDHRSQESVKKIKTEIANLLSDLFSHALPLTKNRCLELMEENDLLPQHSREMSYWLAKDTPYVGDLRKGEINRDAYPHLPAMMQGCILTETQADFLQDCGFHDPTRDQPGECQLGSGSGRMPLIALNAMVVKLLAHGTIKSVEIQQQKMSQQAQVVAEQQFIV